MQGEQITQEDRFWLLVSLKLAGEATPEELAELETFLQQRNWSEDLQEDLISQLPWQEERLEALSPKVNPQERSASTATSRDEKLAVAIAIQSVTPFETTRCLAVIVRFLLDD